MAAVALGWRKLHGRRNLAPAGLEQTRRVRGLLCPCKRLVSQAARTLAGGQRDECKSETVLSGPHFPYQRVGQSARLLDNSRLIHRSSAPWSSFQVAPPGPVGLLDCFQKSRLLATSSRLCACRVKFVTPACC